MVAGSDRTGLTQRQIFAGWWPLALSWACMAAELPALTAVVSRLPDPKVQMAAYGGLVFPIALIVESPVIMLLAASTALSRDRPSYDRIYRYMMAAGLGLTALHAAVAFTPAFDWIARSVLGAPEATLAPARLGLAIMLPWTWAIGHRRFQQGVLIRAGKSRAVGLGTVLRIGTVALVLGVGFRVGRLPGAALASLAVISGVVLELAYVAWASRAAVAALPRHADPGTPPLTLRGFLRFYVPLILTSLLSLLTLPLVAAALGRMPRPLDSLATWPALDGLLFILQSGGVALNEVVLALIDRPGATPQLLRFSRRLSLGLTAIVLIMAASPLGELWFARVMGLRPELVPLALTGLWLAVPAVAAVAVYSWLQARLMHAHRTRAVTESVLAFLGVTGLLLALALGFGRWTGLYPAVSAMTAGVLTQTAWLAWRVRGLAGPVSGGGAAGTARRRGYWWRRSGP